MAKRKKLSNWKANGRCTRRGRTSHSASIKDFLPSSCTNRHCNCSKMLQKVSKMKVTHISSWKIRPSRARRRFLARHWHSFHPLAPMPCRGVTVLKNWWTHFCKSTWCQKMKQKRRKDALRRSESNSVSSKLQIKTSSMASKSNQFPMLTNQRQSSDWTERSRKKNGKCEHISTSSKLSKPKAY